MKLEGENFTGKGYVVLSVKGDEMAGFANQITLELKNKKGESGKYLLKGITKDWNKFAIRFLNLRG